MTVLKLNNISKVYGKKAAFQPFTFQADKGTVVALCGGNGAGKSTLLQMVAGLVKPSTGSIQLDNMDINKDRKKYVSNIGYMPDDFLAQETMTVEEFLQFYATFRNIQRKQVQEMIDILSLTKKKNMKIKQLSKGMRQRLILGQAYIGNPALLLLDEPTNGLDPYWIHKFIQLLKERKKGEGLTIFSTHMMDVAAEVADIILFLDKGKVTHEFGYIKNKEQMTLQLLKLHRGDVG